jgi:predicted methyltransferase
MIKIALYLAIGLSFLTSGCSEAPDEKLVNAATGNHRSTENIARNTPRHSIETLKFFGLKKTMTVMEIWPGSSGWYSEILAPYLRDNGTFYAANFNGSTGVQYFENAAAKFKRKLAASPEIYGQVQTVDLMPPNNIAPVPENSIDLILTFRNLHNWVNANIAEQMFEVFFKALKPGGTLGLVAHRGTAVMTSFDKGYTGYLAESVAIELAKNAGLELVAKSEVNANPKDTKDYTDGVWTLPPNFKKGELNKQKYVAIGESDRMTLKFRKPN